MTSVRVDRHCPRCHKHRMHRANIATQRITCAECGHQWQGRLKPDERPGTLNDIRRIAKEHGGRVISDGCGGYEVLAPPDRRWIDAEVQCYVLPLNEYEPEEVQDELQQCVDMIQRGHEPYPNK